METENNSTIVNPEDKILNFRENKVEVLTLDELKLTTGEVYFGDKEQNDIQHHDFINRILQMALTLNLEASVDTIYAAQNKAKHAQGVAILPALEEKYGEGAIQAHILRRVLTRIVIEDFSDDISSTAIAISYHQDGIEVALGPNIKICSNQCILGSGRYMRTYGVDKMPDHEKMLEVVGEWLHTFEEKRIEDQTTLKAMQEFMVDYPTMAKIIGELSLMRIAKDNLNVKSNYPLSQSQITKVSEAYLKDMLQRKENDQDQVISLYDVYNYGTAELKPNEMEIPNVLMQNAAFGNYIIDMVSSK